MHMARRFRRLFRRLKNAVSAALSPLRLSYRCLLLGHVRSRRYARPGTVEGEWRSICRFCDEPMVRSHRGRWRLQR